MDKNSIFRVNKSEKGRIVEFGVGLKNIRLDIWGPKALGLEFRGQQRNSGMDPPVLKARECAPGIMGLPVGQRSCSVPAKDLRRQKDSSTKACCKNQ